MRKLMLVVTQRYKEKSIYCETKPTAWLALRRWADLFIYFIINQRFTMVPSLKPVCKIRSYRSELWSCALETSSHVCVRS